ncbi:response regulator transcription factor [Nonomuraea rhizosphaerae]|uniref:response regulator transcription factor n=1 Tax=Nonomuraea rhizosphaerae TaxID=2665663 RepID=UPI0027E356E3|nr:response regulator transcription factor [Nonomuraea rhizosphaerae]
MSADFRVLVVDDEPAVLGSVRDVLELDGYDVRTAADGRAALAAVARLSPDVVVLDVVIPGLDGLGVCRRLRADGDWRPVLVLTGRDAVGDRVDGLDAGADDYLVKPFAPAELLARLRALLRRARPDAPPHGSTSGEHRTSGGELAYADLVLEPQTRRGRRGGRVIQFSRTEFALLELLVRNAGQVLTRELVLERVWGYDLGPASNTLAVHIGYLRRKLGEPQLVQTVRGVGYLLRSSP